MHRCRDAACSLDWFSEWQREASKHKLVRLRIYDDVTGDEVHVEVKPDGDITTMGGLSFLNWVAEQLMELRWPHSIDGGESRQIYKRTGNPAEHLVVVPGCDHRINPDTERYPVGPHGELETFAEFMARKKAEQNISGGTPVLPPGSGDVTKQGATIKGELDSSVSC